MSAEDRAQAESVRSFVQIDRAVRRAHESSAPPLRVSAFVAAELGWALCPVCTLGIATGGGVTYRAELLHPECVATRFTDVAA